MILWCPGSRRNKGENILVLYHFIWFSLFWMFELRQYFENKSLKGPMLTAQCLNSSKCLSKLTCCVSSLCSLCSHSEPAFALICYVLWSFHNLCHCSSYFLCLKSSSTISVWATLIYLLIPNWNITFISPLFSNFSLFPTKYLLLFLNYIMLCIYLWLHCVGFEKKMYVYPHGWF